MFDPRSFDPRSFDARSFFSVIAAIVRRVRQSHIVTKAVDLFVSLPPAVFSVKKRVR